MRLLHIHTYKFEQFENDVPPYAILSHRWNKSEPRLADVERWLGLKSQGRPPDFCLKVYGFAQYVATHLQSVQWIWIDSCCINQDSAGELSESINRMFAWYRDAKLCVVYLADVEHASDWGTLRKSCWFKRGWTLQELVASTTVVFVSKMWQVIGHKGQTRHLPSTLDCGPNIEALLSEVTRIPQPVLQDYSNSLTLTLTFDDKMLWMEGRQTLKEEDMIYSLFGIFGVTPGANYGEGKLRARRRLLKALQEEEDTENDRPARRRKPDSDADPVIVAPATQARSTVEAWLSAPDPSVNHMTAREHHEPGTCAWLLRHDVYNRWKSGGSRHLWLHGKPGCGKSILCSTVIEDLLEEHKTSAAVGLAYFYFTFSDIRKQSYHDLLLALVDAVGKKEPARSMLHHIHNTNSRANSGTAPTPDAQELEKILAQIVASYDEVFVIVDALDESPELDNTRQDLLERLTRLLSLVTNLRLFATSRYMTDICEVMEDLTSQQISINPDDINVDIQSHVVAQLATKPRLRKFTPVVKKMIERNVSENADGMFRWADLLLKELSKLKHSGTKSIETALKCFPADLDTVYARILQDISGQDQQHALTLLYWISYARRPLKLGELIDALTIDLEHDSVDLDNRCVPEDIFRMLASLIVAVSYGRCIGEHDDAGIVINEQTEVRFAHFTVQEYLESLRVRNGPASHFSLDRRTGHRFLTQSCVTYILHYSSSSAKDSTGTDLVLYPLLYYAAESWYRHSLARGSTDVEYEIRLLSSHSARQAWLRVHKPDKPHMKPFDCSYVYKAQQALYYATYVGPAVLKAMLAPIRFEVPKSIWDDGILRAASDAGHLECVRLLLEAGAKVMAKDTQKLWALATAVRRGHAQIVKLLLLEAEVPVYRDDGADVNASFGTYHNALQLAAWQDYTEIMQLLLAAGAHVNRQGGPFGCALQAAATRSLLIQQGHEFNALQDYQMHVMLLEQRNKRDLMRTCNPTTTEPLDPAVFEDMRAMKMVLLRIDDLRGDANAVLQALCREPDRNVETVKLLLDHGARIDQLIRWDDVRLENT